MFQGRITLTSHGIELEDGIEIHQLDACDAVNLLSRDDILQVIIHCIECDGVAIGTGIPENSTVVANHHKVHSPGVNTDGCDFQTTLSHFFQTTDHLEVQGVDIPIEMTTLFDEVIGETGYFLQLELSFVDTSYYGSATCSTQVDSEEIFFLIHH